ncbi:MAG: hypothetical protein OEZ43_21795 [Gammaproteobacteria bacterium]|nr:hypothetical protein [Gammaproteobacteria bacterium]MDH5548213.1 hypothetical protein [Gammaproteobacteria bacterium]
MRMFKRNSWKWILLVTFITPFAASAMTDGEKAFKCVIDDARFDVYWGYNGLLIPKDTPFTVSVYSNDFDFLVMFFTTNRIHREIGTDDKLGKIGLGNQLFYNVKSHSGPCGLLEDKERPRLFIVDKTNEVPDDATYDRMLGWLDKEDRVKHDYHRRLLARYQKKVFSKTVIFNSDWEPEIDKPPSPEKLALIEQFRKEEHEKSTQGFKVTYYIADFNMNWPYTFMYLESERIEPLPGKKYKIDRLVFELYFVEPNKKYQYLNFPPDQRYRTFPTDEISIYVDGRWKFAKDSPEFVEKIKKRAIEFEIVKPKNASVK